MQGECVNMDVSGKRAFDLLKSLAYVRVSGTPEEKQAAQVLLNVVKKDGVEGYIDTFPVHAGKVHRARLTVTAPYVKEYECTGFIRGESTPEGGLETELVYVEGATPVNLARVEGKVALINGRLNYKLYEKLMGAKVAGIISYSGTVIDRESETDIDILKLRETWTEPFGFTVAVNVRAKSAMDMVKKKASRVRIEVESERFDVESRNVRAVIPGTQYPDEVIDIGGHYDSVMFSTGVYDNMAGTVIVLELMHYFAAHPPKRTLRFHCFGSEEQGLLGSKAFCAAHEEEVKKTRLMVNIDIGGSVLGSEKAIVTGSEALTHYVEGILDEAGLAVEVSRDIYSSDSIPFADRGVPGINLLRAGAPGAAFIHDRRDNLKNGFLSAEGLESTARVALEIVRRVANAGNMPVKREIPDDIREKVDKYLFRKK